MGYDIINRLLWASKDDEEKIKDNKRFFISSIFTNSSGGGDDDEGEDRGSIWNPQTISVAVIAAGTVIVFSRFYRRYLKRIPTAGHLNPSIDLVHKDLNTGEMIPGRIIYGKVVSVGDGDNFRLFHTPGGIWAGWGWLRHVPNIPGSGLSRQRVEKVAAKSLRQQSGGWFNHNNTNTNTSTGTFIKNNDDGGRHVLWKAARKVFGLDKKRRKKNGKDNLASQQGFKKTRLRLTNSTIHIRLCGIDAPEMAHFGQPGQPFGKEALNWLTSYLLGHNVWVKLFNLDQYGRVVGHVHILKWNGLRDVGADMLRRGFATVYEAKTGAQYNGKESYYRRLQAKAQKNLLGLWSQQGHIQSPREYKNQNKNID